MMLARVALYCALFEVQIIQIPARHVWQALVTVHTTMGALRASFAGCQLTRAWMVLSFLVSIAGLRAQELPLPPANDHFTNAALVTGSEFVLTADLASATSESFEPWKGGWGSHTAWWRWIAPQSGIYTWEVPTNSNLATLAVFRRDAFQQLTPIAETFWRLETGLLHLPPQSVLAYTPI
jgi:hypothetical protein